MIIICQVCTKITLSSCQLLLLPLLLPSPPSSPLLLLTHTRRIVTNGRSRRSHCLLAVSSRYEALILGSLHQGQVPASSSSPPPHHHHHRRRRRRLPHALSCLFLTILKLSDSTCTIQLPPGRGASERERRRKMGGDKEEQERRIGGVRRLT